MALQHPIETPVLELFAESGRNVRRAAGLLRELLEDFPERAELAGTLVACEHEGDRITHDIIHRLDGARGPATAVAGIEARDGHRLATALDDIVDYAEQAADELVLYGVEAPMEQATLQAELLVAAADEVAAALVCLAHDEPLGAHLVEIHRLENEADRLGRDAVAALFATGIDPMVVIRWKDIFETLEQSIDACETVAHVLEGIALKRRR